MARHCGQLATPVLLLLAGAFGIMLLAIPTRDVEEPPDYMYGIVLDAGSSHTALYIYKWPADKENGTGIVTQHSECHVEGGGISSYASQPGGAGKSLETCLNQAKQDVPQGKHAQTPIYLGATAGMRLLNMSSPEDSDRVLMEVKEKVSSYPFKFQRAEILTGQLEGAYGWVTINYLLENFIKYGFVGRWLSPGQGTVGAMDFGGASTQISFVTQEKLESPLDSMTLRLYGQEYRLYTHSFLCYGRDQALRKVLASMMQTQNFVAEVTHPCYPAGHSVDVKLGQVFDSPCTQGQRPSPYRPDSVVRVLGSGNYGECRNVVSQIFSLQDCPFSRCSFNSVFQPPVSGRFLAFSAFFYTSSFLQRATGISVNSPAQMKSAAQAVCAMTFKQMREKVPDQEKRLQDYCTISVFIEVLMLDAYGFDNSTFPLVSFQKQVGDTSIGWALGYMLSLSSLLPEESLSVRKALRPWAWAVLLLLFVLLLLLALVLLLLHLCRSRKSGGAII
ncbi:ectonucleoside triphosphate diphosphohydrolase 2-like [Lepisosteus oculatus]|nr:PREDICTED: ectonucleoside triphosphate diphosphohydrolase 2-like [Lepisosteus oculatus]XP_015222246.1 PREDICTED: ectonucleoside triphosphate diphosphohydrolase 2-like [Lepisosteus oculatus]